MKTIEITDKQYERLVSHVHDVEMPDSAAVERILNFYEGLNGGNGAPPESPYVEPKAEEPQVVTPFACKPNERVQLKRRRTVQQVEYVFHPIDEEAFKRDLLKKRKGYIRIYKADGSVVDEVWNATRITKASKMKPCLRNMFRRWGITGIVKVVASTNSDGLS